MRNDPNDPIQRSVLVDRRSSYVVKAQLSSVVHGYMSSESKVSGTLILLEFSFIPLKTTRRIKSATISLQFTHLLQSDRDPVVSAIAPYGDFVAYPSSHVTPAAESNLAFNSVIGGASLGLSMGWERTESRDTTSAVSIVGLTEVRGRNHGPPNTVLWTVNENKLSLSGIPSSIRTAVLLERGHDETYFGNLEIETDVAGFSFRDFQSGMAENGRDDPIIFDPRRSPMGYNLDFDLNELSSVNLEDFVSINTVGGIGQIEQVEHENQQALEELFESVSLEAGKSMEKAEDLGKSESFYVEFWNLQLSNSEWVPNESSEVKAQSAQFPNIPSEDVSGKIGPKHLKRYFSWLREKPPPPPSPEDQQEPVKPTALCSLIFRRSDRNGFASFEQLKELFSEPPVQTLMNFFDLPEDYMFSRRHDRGICQLIPSRKDGKPLKAYMIQTPFYGEGGFWSLVMVCMSESDSPDSPSKICAVMHTDQDSHLTTLFEEVQGLSKRYGRHPMILPLELFRTHCRNTSTRFGTLLARVRDVDERLLAELEPTTKPEKSRKEYLELSKILHECNIELEELGRRRKFEETFGKQLTEDLQFHSGLSQIATMSVNISKSRDVSIDSLPGKMDSQRSVLSGLIAQYDNNTSSRLARESLRDSKAMKTLSVLTILFLPGAFVATVFSTEMFEFRDKKQEIWIYFAIVVPLTVVIMIGWLLWLKSTPYNRDGDEEAGEVTVKGEKGEGVKDDDLRKNWFSRLKHHLLTRWHHTTSNAANPEDVKEGKSD